MPVINNRRIISDPGYNHCHKLLFLSAVSIIIFSMISCPVSALEIYPGESVDLRGSCTSDYVYLFITGPNLPSNGANPEDIYEEVVTGSPSSFVKVDAFNNRWSYTWDTKTSGGNPDTGTYTFFAGEKPVGRHDLSGVEYSTKTVRLLDPSVSVSGVSSFPEGTDKSVYPEKPVFEDEPSAAKTTTPVSPTLLTAEGTSETTPGVTGTPATGISPALLILSLVVSSIIIPVRKKRAGKI